jgi:hypothetical protein
MAENADPHLIGNHYVVRPASAGGGQVMGRTDHGPFAERGALAQQQAKQEY